MLNSMIRKASRDGAPPISSVSTANVRLLHSELTRSSWLIAVVGSILNAVNASGDLASLAQIENFLPAQPRSGVVLSEHSDPGTQALVLSLDQFHGQVDMARRMTATRLSMISTMQDGSACANVPDVVSVLAETWRKLALAAQLQLYQVQAVVVRSDATGTAHVSQETIIQLKQVARGESPCLDRAGMVHFGGLIDRRGAPRVVVNMKVGVRSHGVEQQCLVTNVSSSGLGLSNVYGVSTGEDIWVCVAERVELPGNVVWADRGHAGVQLQEELSAAEWLDMPRSRMAHAG